MAISNRDRVHQGLELLKDGLVPFVERMLKARLGGSWQKNIDSAFSRGLRRTKKGVIAWDNQSLLKVMDRFWRDAFDEVLGRTERAFVNELIEVRNAFAHDEPFSSSDTERALDSVRRLLEAVSAKTQAEEVDRNRIELQRTVFAEQARQQTRRKTLTLEGTPAAGLKPWREVVTPHPDVSSGHYQEA